MGHPSLVFPTAFALLWVGLLLAAEGFVRTV
jgi:hypothetical protein